MTASTKSQRITPEREPHLPCWLWGRVNIIYPSPVSHWRKSSDMPNAGVQYLPGWPTDKNRPGTFLATHWHPDQPDAPQEVPTLGGDVTMKRHDDTGNPDPGFLTGAAIPSDPASSAPSKETIAKETARELMQHTGIPSGYNGWVKSEQERIYGDFLSSIILRALDRAGEAKGADARIPVILVQAHNALNDCVTQLDVNAFTNKPVGTTIARAKDVASRLAAITRPPASVDAGTPRETPRTNAVEFETIGPNGAPFKVVEADFARTLEREVVKREQERDASIHQIRLLREDLSSLAVQLEEAKAHVADMSKSYFDQMAIAAEMQNRAMGAESALAEKEKKCADLHHRAIQWSSSDRPEGFSFESGQSNYWGDAYKDFWTETGLNTDCYDLEVIVAWFQKRLRASPAAPNEDKRRQSSPSS